VIGNIVTSPKDEEAFSERMSLFFKSIAVRRIYDKTTGTLVYVAYSRQVKDASAKMSPSTGAFFNANATGTPASPKATGEIPPATVLGNSAARGWFTASGRPVRMPT
jgi:CreA protein